MCCLKKMHSRWVFAVVCSALYVLRYSNESVEMIKYSDVENYDRDGA